MESTREKLTKARVQLIVGAPFFGALAMRLALQERPEIQTAETDGRAIFYNPAFVDSLTFDETKTLLTHEIMHCALCHTTRRDSRDADLWNQAADYAINGELQAAGFVLPAGGLVSDQFTGQSAESIYKALADRRQEESGGDSGQGQGGQDSGAAPAPGDWGKVLDAPTESAAQAAAMEREWQAAAIQAARVAKAAGQGSAGIDRLLQGLVRPRADWRDLLRRFMEQTARADYSWIPPNRRYIWRGLYLPGLSSESMPPIVVAVDTSGSVGQAELDQAAAEIADIGANLRPAALWVVYCDSEINGAQCFEPGQPIELQPCGGGGTRFAPVFDWIDSEQIAPAALVYLTDLHCSHYPETAPDYPVLWATDTSPQSAYARAVPFGDVIHLCE